MSRFARKPPFGSRLDWRHTLATGLVGYWLLNEGGGDNIYDLTNQTRPGELHANVAKTKWGAGRHGLGLLGAGGEFDRVTIPATPADLTFSLGDRISISVWAKRDVTAFSVPLASRSTTAANLHNWALKFSNSNSLDFDYHSAAGGVLQRWSSDSSLTGTELRHVAFDYIYGTAASAKAYADGLLLGSSGFVLGDGNQSPDTGDGSAYLGYDVQVGGGMNGWLFQVAVWKNRPGGLSTQDVIELYRHPYALVLPVRRRVGLIAGQTAYPATDISAGTWTPSSGSDLYAMINEAVTDDGDYDRSGAAPVDDTMEVSLTPLSTPEAGDVSFTVRHKAP